MIPMEDKLLDLFAGLSRASARSRLHAMRAKKDGRKDLALLFMAVAESQAMQARRFLVQLRGTVDTTDENERSFFEVELPEAIRRYAELLGEAEQQDLKGLATGFRHSTEVDRCLGLLRHNLDDPAGENDYYVCDFCGYVAVDEPPDNCPVCSAPRDRFKHIEEA